MGKYKHGKPDKEISLQDFKQKLLASKLPIRQRAYLVLLYWLGARRSEPLKILKEDIEAREGSIYISIHWHREKKFSRAKRGQAGGPIELPLNYFGVDFVKFVWQKTRKGKKVFPFSDVTGYRALKQLWPKKSPHWLRYNRVTKLRKKLGQELTIDSIKSFTGIRRDRTIQDYGLKTKADIHKIAGLLD